MNFMEKRKLGNVKQIMSAYEMEITSGTATGKKILLVNNGAMEVMFNCDNALDIGWVKYHGQNISFLTKNGFNNNAGPFGQKFEGGLFTPVVLTTSAVAIKNRLSTEVYIIEKPKILDTKSVKIKSKFSRPYLTLNFSDRTLFLAVTIPSMKIKFFLTTLLKTKALSQRDTSRFIT